MSYKRKFLRKTILSMAAMSLMLGGTVYAADFSIDNLKVNKLVAPIALDAKNPNFGWQMKADLNKPENLQQKFYQITVKDSAGKIVWDTGKISSGESQNIYYDGEKLLPETSYTWTVKVWDNDGDVKESTSTFATGLNLERQGTGNWDGANFIGSNKLSLDSHRLSVFKIRTKIKILPNSTNAGIIFGANDERLMYAEKNMWKISSAKNQSRIEMILDIGDLKNSQPAKLKFFRHGYAKNDSENPIVNFEIPTEIINSQNANDFHEILLSSNHGIISFTIDGKSFEMPEVNFWSRGYVVNPAGPGGDYISFPTVSDIGFIAGKNQQAEISDFEILNYREPMNAVFKENLSEKSIFQGKQGITISNNTYKINGGNTGIAIIENPSHGAMPLLRTNLKIDNKKISRATIYATARGIYELYLNGERVEHTYFAPELTQYDQTQLYQAYDITDSLKTSDNILTAQLGEGWWSGAQTFQGEQWNYFGDRQSFMAKIVVDYADGTKKIFTTQPDTWQFTESGPVISASFFQGENYDARREKNITDWQNAKIIPINENTTYLGSAIHPITRVEKKFDYSNVNFIAQEDEGVQVVDYVEAKSVKKIADKVYIYDLGQNLAGVPRIAIKNGKAGNKVTMRFAEFLYPENDAERGGTLMLENIRGALATDEYTLKGGEELICPRMTYHGFRFLEVTGLDELNLQDVGAIVYSSAKDLTGNFECSDEDINRLYQNILWSTRANFLSIPTDCPQRNERMGWSGDLSVFAPTASYIWNTENFLRRHMQAVRDLQDEQGRFPDIAPIGGGFGGINWGSVGMTVPYELYLQYGDKKILEENYNAMKNYVDYLEKHIGEDGTVSEGTMMELGDWLGPENSKNDAKYLLAAAEILDVDILQKSANILGKSFDAEKYKKIYTDRKNWFNKKYFDKKTHRSLNTEENLMDTQTSYAVALGNNILNKNEKNFAEKFLIESVERKNIDDEKIERPEYSLMTGFIGTAKISKALSQAGRSDIAYKLLENHQYPSWLYPVDQGATTIWERLNSYTKANGFGGNNSMNSFNHYSFGAVGAWLYEDSLGICRDENNPGWKKFILQPQPDFGGEMKFAKGQFNSPYGIIQSSWEILGDETVYNFVIPANTSAHCKLIASGKKIIVNGEVKNLSAKNKFYELDLIPGSWKISISK